VLKINKLVKKYDGSTQNTLNISEVVFKKSTITRLIGTNGIGKTTFLSVVSGLSNFEGEIIFNNCSIRENYQEYLSMTAYVGNDYFLYDFLTGSEMIRFVQNALDFNSSIKDDLMDFCSESGLSEYLNVFTKDLSLGTKQKLGIVLALLANPKVLLLDEPFVNLDELSKKALIKILKIRTKQDGLLTIYATHSLEEELENLADQTLRLTNDEKSGAYFVWE